MFAAFFFSFIHMVAVLPGVAPAAGTDQLSQSVLTTIASPLLNAMQLIIPGAVAVAGLHKVMEHRESGGAFLVEMVTKGGGAFLLIQLVKSLFPGV